jgi:phage antirepressor YoqD-like protein
MIQLTSGDQTQKMNSKEIAELTGKEHSHIMRDIRNLQEQIGNESIFGLVSYKDTKGEIRPMYELDKKQTLLLISGYNALLRLKIIDRWEELEQQKPKLPQTYSEALRELADVTEQKLILEQRNEKLEPRSTYFEQMIMTDGLISMEQAAKLLNIKDMGRNNLFKALRTGNVIQKHNTSPKQYYIDKGYFELKEEIIEVKKVRKVIVTTLVTQKGLAFLFKFFGLTKKSLPN